VEGLCVSPGRAEILTSILDVDALPGYVLGAILSLHRTPYSLHPQH